MYQAVGPNHMIGFDMSLFIFAIFPRELETIAHVVVQ